MIFFLDDSVDRTRVFKREVIWAKCATTAQEMIDLLVAATDPILMVFLDHDLGGEVYVDSSREDCGMEVVRWIERNQPKVGQFVVHSYNIPAAKEMEQRLRAIGYDVVRILFGQLPYDQICRAWENFNAAS